MPTYVQCFPDPESVVKAVQPVLELERSDYESALSQFVESERAIADWTIPGKKGSLTIKFEEQETYLFVKVDSEQDDFERAKSIFQSLYRRQNGEFAIMDDTLIWETSAPLN